MDVYFEQYRATTIVQLHQKKIIKLTGLFNKYIHAVKICIALYQPFYITDGKNRHPLSGIINSTQQDNARK
jgi:hypothetical protein